jgi:hypothetical protein
MTTDEAFIQMINIRGIFHKLDLAKGTVGKMRSDLITGNAKISLDKKIELLKKAGYKVKQEMEWNESEIAE